MPAEKKLYRTDYVLQHFVHYSSVTTLSNMNRSDYVRDQGKWKPRAFPDPRQRVSNEVTEALMIHAKAIAILDTVNWNRTCRIDMERFLPDVPAVCPLGLAWPVDRYTRKGKANTTLHASNLTTEGLQYNCFVNDKVERYFVPQLMAALKPYAHMFTGEVKMQIEM
jgi:hypothetical protein